VNDSQYNGNSIEYQMEKLAWTSQGNIIGTMTL